jgi:high-affinity iron transporter
MAMDVDRQLLAKRELHDGLLLATTKECEDAPKDRDRESRCRPHRAPILLESTMRREAESDSTSDLPSEDDRHTGEKREQNQRGRIMRTHTRSARSLVRALDQAIRLPTARCSMRYRRALVIVAAALTTMIFLGCRPAESAPAPASSSGSSASRLENDVRRIVALLDYVTSDYAAAIAGGDPTEYKEQVSFVQDAADRVARLPTPNAGSAADVRAAIAHTTDLVERGAAPADVADACRHARDALLAAYPVRLAPHQPPSRTVAAETFASACATCHGQSGNGDGPGASGLRPPPRSFRDSETMLGMSPARAFAAIADGVPGTAMPSFTSVLRERDRWSLAFYVMSLRFDAPGAVDGAIVSRVARLRGLDRLSLSTDREMIDAIAVAQVPEAERGAALAYLRGSAPFVESNANLVTTRRGLAEARAAYRRGDREAARSAVDDAYLDGFEPLEGRLRVSAPELVASIEEQVLDLRESIARGVPAASLDADLDVLEARLDAVEARSSGGSGGTAIFIASLVVVLREGVEAFLLITLLLGLASRAGGPSDRHAVHAGWIVALGAGAVTWLASGIVERVGGGNRELLEGLVALLAVVVLLYAGHFVLARLDAQRRIAALKRRFAEVSMRRRFAILFSLGFVALYREAFEVVLFLRAIALGATGADGALALGVLAGVALCVVAAGLMDRFGRRLSPGTILNLAGALLCLLAVVLAGKGVRSLQEAAAVSVHAFAGPRVDWLGLYPTWETVAAQVVTIAAIAVVAIIGTRLEATPEAQGVDA